MKKDTFETAVEINNSLKQIDESLNKLVAHSENSKLYVMRIFSILDKDGNSRELQLNFKGNDLENYKFLPEKTRSQIEILSQTYRETMERLENDFTLLEDLE